MSDSKFINTALAVVPVFSGTLYLMGYMYYLGFLDVYGIESSLFPLPSDITLLYGFYVLIPTVVSLAPVFYAVLAMFILLLMLGLTYLLASNSRVVSLHKRLFAKKANKNKNNPEIKKKLDDILDKGETIYYYYLGVFLILFFTVLLTQFAIISGKDEAIKSIDKFSNQTGKWVMLYTSLSSSPVKAQQVTCGKTHCAFWLGNEALIIAHDKIEKVVAHRESTKK